jgi:hypothetical protein
MLQNRHIVAPITKFESTPECGFAIADLTPAYPDGAISLRRGIALLDRARVLVQDEYQPTPTNLPLHWRMVTGAKIDLGNDGRSATLTCNGKTLRADLLEPAAAIFRIGSTKPPTSAENQNDGTAFLAIDLNANTEGSIKRLAVLLTPEENGRSKLNLPPPKPLAEW